jgi:hypothetical protein
MVIEKSKLNRKIIKESNKTDKLLIPGPSGYYFSLYGHLASAMLCLPTDSISSNFNFELANSSDKAHELKPREPPWIGKLCMKCKALLFVYLHC